MRTEVQTATIFPPLVCPLDHKQLRDDGGALVCDNGHSYAIRAGIPRVVKSENSYASAFGAQWNTFTKTQLDSFTGSPVSHDRLKRCLGDALWQQMNGSEPVAVLETGCGAGRFTEVLLTARSTFVTSTDLSAAVEANQTNCPQSDRHRVVQCDIYELPFVPASYDIVICLGVIQHTPNPEATIAKLYEQVKPGGWLIIDHYTPSLARATKITSGVLRPILKRLSPARGMRATEMLTKTFFPLHRAVKDKPLLQNLLSRVSPLLTYYHAYPQLDDRLQYEWALLDTHDSLTDYYKHLRTRGQISQTLSQLGATSIWVAKGGNGVEARCQKPVV